MTVPPTGPGRPAAAFTGQFPAGTSTATTPLWGWHQPATSALTMPPVALSPSSIQTTWYAPGHLAKMTTEILAQLDVDFLRVDHIRHTNGNRALERAPQARRGVRLDPRESTCRETAATMVDYPYSWKGIFNRSLAGVGAAVFPRGATYGRRPRVDLAPAPGRRVLRRGRCPRNSVSPWPLEFSHADLRRTATRLLDRLPRHLWNGRR